MKKRLQYRVGFLIIIFSAFVLSACNVGNGEDQKKDSIRSDADKRMTIDSQAMPTNTPIVTPNPQCAWIEKADVIIKVNFAEGVEKDTSYETGFYLSPIMSNMRLARKDCDYQTGFTFEELKKIGEAEVGVRGYSDNKRRIIEGEPISVTIDTEGKPDIGNYIEVKITN